MREISFHRWLGGQPVNAHTAAMRVRAVARVARAYDIDLDAEYARDGLAGLLDQFQYSTDDAAAGRPNPTRMNIVSGDIRSQVAWYRTQINSYRKFSEDHPPSREADIPRDLGVVSADTELPLGSNIDDEYESDGLTFALEADLETALRAELMQLEPGLTVADGGRQRRVPSGFIDILARGTDGAHVVIELKAGQTRPEAVAQVLGYMGDIAAETQGDVRGYLIGADHHPRVSAAVRAVPGLSLRRYTYRFRFD